jgi:hypothetical protein
MSIQKDYKEIENVLLASKLPETTMKLWHNLSEWITKKGMFGPYGYDFENDRFLKEPVDPRQMDLPFGK